MRIPPWTGRLPFLPSVEAVFCAEFCEAGELLMECVGEVVRRPVASMREAAAAARGVNDVACYVFALDADHVVDTTKSGNPARFVNHSCRCLDILSFSQIDYELCLFLWAHSLSTNQCTTKTCHE